MPNTYVALDTRTIQTATPSVTFSSIPGGYTDLVLIISGTVSSEGAVRFQCNGDTSTNYSTTLLFGNGSSPLSGRAANQNFGAVGRIGTVVSNSIIHFMNYSNTTTFKTVISRGNTSNLFVTAQATLWRATPAAITSIVLTPENAANWDIGCTFSLYGIANADLGAAKATGGTITEDANYWYHTFGASGTFIPKQSLTCDILAVAGGGGGGYSRGGGGGAGGLLAFTSQSLTATNYSVTVGAAGAGSSSGVGANGTNSQFASLTASVGGGGGATGASASTAGNGGSGGGGVGFSGDRAGGTGTSGQGSAGGTGKDAGPNYGAGGGGGVNAVGGNGTSTVAGNGGTGSSAYSTWAIATGTGSSNAYAGGGGGASYQGGTSGTGGTGGGANGGVLGIGSNAIANTGGGGGGGGHDATTPKAGGNGGSGIVIVRYAK